MTRLRTHFDSCYLYSNHQDVATKVQLVLSVDRRRKLLRHLRKQNFVQFEKVKQELGVDWVPFGRYDYYPLSKRMREKDGIIKEAYRHKMAALKEYMAYVRTPQMQLEISQLKKDLGQELTKEEQEILKQSEEMEDVKT